MQKLDNLAEEQKRQVSRRVLRRAAWCQFAAEFIETAKLALPMVMAQIGQVAMATTDLVLIGRMGPDALAAAALAGRIYLISFTFGLGLLAPIGPMVAQAFGANNLAVVRRSVRMGLWAAPLLAFPIMVCAARGEQILATLGQAPDVARRAQQYLLGLAWGAAPALWFQTIRIFMAAVNRPEPVFWITLAAVPANALLVYLLIYGELGLPRLELFGAGLATALVNCGMLLAALWFATMRRPFRDYYLTAHFWCFDGVLMWELIVIGTPISLTCLISYGVYSAAALLAGLISTSALAAHQIALQVAAILSVVSFGVSMAATVRVGQAVGRNDFRGIKRVGMASMLLGVLIAAALTLAVIAARFRIPKWFLGETAVDGDATNALAATLLFVGASCLITAAMQNVAAGGLSGMKDTRAPLLFGVIAHWLIGFSLSYMLGVKIGLGAVGVWIGLSIGTAICAVLLVARFRVLANRLDAQSRYLSS